MGTHVYVLLRPIDLGDRVHGVFTSRVLAETALAELIRGETLRLGLSEPPLWLTRIRVEVVPVNQVYEI